MKRYDVRFWDKTNKVMIYGAGIAPTQKPIVKHENGVLEELKGEFVPMICTGVLSADRKPIWEADVIECDIPYQISPDMPPSFVKARGVMQYNPIAGSFTVNINSSPERAGDTFQVTNSRIIGNALANPELLEDKQQNYEQHKEN